LHGVTRSHKICVDNYVHSPKRTELLPEPNNKKTSPANFQENVTTTYQHVM